MAVLAELPQDQVDDARAELLQLLQEAFPDVDFRGGVVSDVVLELAAVLATHSRAELDLTRRAGSLLEITRDPVLADDLLVDRVLSNYRVTRLPGAPARGNVVIVLNQQAPASVGSNTLFVGNGQEFRTEFAYTARLSQDAISSETDRLLLPLGDGTYGFTIPVVAVTTGVAGMLKRGTTLSAVVPFQHFVKAYAAADFTDGFDAETNADLIDKLESGMAIRAWSNRVSADALLRNQTAFERILQTSIIGYGDVEMQRDQRSLFPISTGGRSDIYVRTQELPQSLSLTKEGTLIEKTSQGGIWQVEVSREDAPAMYDVIWVGKADGGEASEGYEVVEDIRGRDMPEPDATDEYLPDVANALEATYSAYQTAVIRFLDTDTPTAELTEYESKLDYTLVVRAMPKIADAQEFFNRRDVRPPQCDVLVRAPVPCFLGLTFNITKRATAPSPDVDSIRQDLARTVNRLGFPGQLAASQLADVVYDALGEGMTIGNIDMHGRLRLPDGDFIRLRGHEALTVPQRAALFTSGRTVAFMLDPADVHIAVVASASPEV